MLASLSGSSLKLDGVWVLKFDLKVLMMKGLEHTGRLVKLGILSFLTSQSLVSLRADSPEVMKPLLKKYCITCHNEKDKKGKFSMENLSLDIVGGEDLESWGLIAEQLEFEEMPPDKKDVKQLPQKDRKALLQWIQGEMLKMQSPTAKVHPKLQAPKFGNYVDHKALFAKRYSHETLGPQRIWRVRPDIYVNMLRAVNSEPFPTLDGSLTMEDGHDLKDYDSIYTLDEAAAAPLMSNAKKVAASMMDPKRSKNNIVKGIMRSEQEASDETVKNVIIDVFRRGINRMPAEEETERFLIFYQKSKKASDQKVALKALLTALLLQPEFMHRSEMGAGPPDSLGRVRLTPVELAYSLSYALDSRLDGELMTKAKQGSLKSKEQIVQALEARWQKGLEANPRIMGFFREYFNHRFAAEVFKDPPPAPERVAHQPSWLIGDLELTIKAILEKDKNVLAELLTTNKYYVNATVSRDKKHRGQKVIVSNDQHKKNKSYASVYNLPLDWEWTAKQPIEFPKGERSGVLTHPAWLAAWSANTENHPVQRGKWIRTHLLGGTVPDVPIGGDAQIPEAEYVTLRDRLKTATKASECWRCHRKMDELGVPFEQFDHWGRFQRLDAGQPVRVDSKISMTGQADLDGLEIKGPAHLLEILSKSEYVKQVFVRHVFRYYMGRNETIGDANTLQDAYQAYNASGGSFKALVISILSSDSFVLRQTSKEEKAVKTNE